MCNALSAPFDAVLQRRILTDRLALVESVGTGSALVDLPHTWPTPFDMYF